MITVKRKEYMIWATCQDNAERHMFGFSIAASPIIGNALIQPLDERLRPKSINPEEEKTFLSIFKNTVIFLKKELDWYPMDLENEASDDNYTWQLARV